MKNYVVTTSFANNYGALLQAYALKSYIQRLTENECCILDYWPEKSEEVWKLYYKINSIRTLLRNIFVFFDFKYKKNFHKRKELMFAFRKQHLNLTKKEYHSQKEVLADKSQFRNSCFFCGSDQIWNTTAYWKDPVYFLDFVKELDSGKAIAYAPSVTDTWNACDKEEIKKYLNQLDSISVREKDDLKQIEELTAKGVSHVIDPVFLLNETEWNDFSKLGKKIDGDYILCYFLGTDQNAIKLVTKLKKLTGIKVVHLNINYHDAFNSDICIHVATPIDFVSLIKNAKYVVCNSFHCSAFSIIFRKDYFVIPKNHANSRMESLQDMAQIGNRLFSPERIGSLSVRDLHIDYSKTNTSLDNMIEFSKKYIKDAIK